MYTSTSWQNVNQWYDKLVGNEGHYYHEHVVLPGVLRLLNVNSQSQVMDLGCGQGVLAHALPSVKKYHGIDAAPGLIAAAKNAKLPTSYNFLCADVTKPLPHLDKDFTHAAFILALQNMKHPAGAITLAAEHLAANGTLVIVLNHPSFRIPRQSGWGTDEKTKQQYRWENRYLTPLEIPINMTPGKPQSKVTWSFHHPLQDYVKMLADNHLVITELEEWSSDKQSQGKHAKMENRARSEFPLFLALKAQKVSS